MGPCGLSHARQGTGDIFAKKDESCFSAGPGTGSRNPLFTSSLRPAVPKGPELGHFRFVFLCNNQQWIVLPSISVLCGSHQDIHDH